MRCELGVLVIGLIALSGCHTSLKYGSGDVSVASWGATAPRLIGPLEGRQLPPGAMMVPGQPYGPDWADLSGSMRKHLIRAGLSPLAAPAPTSVESARRTLEAARKAGVPVAVVRLNVWRYSGVYHDWIGITFLLGLAPGFICMAIPMHSEIAEVQLQAVVVDTRTEEVLGRFVVTGRHQDTTTAYTWDPADGAVDAAKRATQMLIDAMSKAARAGYPKRAKSDDLAGALLARVTPPAVVLPPVTGAPAKRAPSAPTTPPAGTKGATLRFLKNRAQIKAGVTTRAQVDTLLGKPTLNQMAGARRQYFYVHSQPENGRVVTRMLYVWFKTNDVVDEVKYTQTP